MDRSSNLSQKKYASNMFSDDFIVFAVRPKSPDFHPTFSIIPPSLENRNLLENPNFVHPASTSMPRSCSIGHSLRGQNPLKNRKISKPPTEIPLKIEDSSKPKDSEVKVKVKSSQPRQQMSEATAAVIIQKAFRGFSVRRSEPLKSLKTIAGLKATTDEIWKRINDPEVEEEEQSKIRDTLISVLLKLDAIQGVNKFVLESKTAVVHTTTKLREIVNVIFGEKLVETKAKTTQNYKEFKVPNTNTDNQQTTSNMPQANNNEDLFQMDTNQYKNGNTHSTECFKEQAMAGQDSSKLKKNRIFNADSEVGAEKVEQGSDDWELLEKPEDESGDIVERLREENKNLKVVIEDLHRREEMQNGIIENLSKELKELKKML